MADRLAAAVYVVVAVIALVGQSWAAVYWIGWPLPAALAAVAGVELTAVALAARADYRRRKGETAVAARLLSAVVAAFMTAVNFVGHWSIGQQVAAWFFGAATGLGYLVWLLNSADRRRDQMLAEGKVRRTSPEYGMWQWVRHPLVTARARQLALRTPELGLYGSLDAAAAELRRAKRDRVLARALRRRVKKAVDANTAKLAVRTYDLGEIAARVLAGADLDAMAALIARDLTPERLAAFTGPSEPSATEPEVDATTPDGQDAEVVPFRQASTRRRPRPATRRPAPNAATPSVEDLVDALCREHCRERPAEIGAPTAMRTLKRLYGSCSTSRARAAKDGHNRRHGFGGSGQAESEDDKEPEAVMAL